MGQLSRPEEQPAIMHWRKNTCRKGPGAILTFGIKGGWSAPSASSRARDFLVPGQRRRFQVPRRASATVTHGQLTEAEQRLAGVKPDRSGSPWAWRIPRIFSGTSTRPFRPPSFDGEDMTEYARMRVPVGLTAFGEVSCQGPPRLFLLRCRTRRCAGAPPHPRPRR